VYSQHGQQTKEKESYPHVMHPHKDLQMSRDSYKLSEVKAEHHRPETPEETSLPPLPQPFASSSSIISS